MSFNKQFLSSSCIEHYIRRVPYLQQKENSRELPNQSVLNEFLEIVSPRKTSSFSRNLFKRNTLGIFLKGVLTRNQLLGCQKLSLPQTYFGKGKANPDIDVHLLFSFFNSPLLLFTLMEVST